MILFVRPLQTFIAQQGTAVSKHEILATVKRYWFCCWYPVNVQLSWSENLSDYPQTNEGVISILKNCYKKETLDMSVKAVDSKYRSVEGFWKPCIILRFSNA